MCNLVFSLILDRFRVISCFFLFSLNPGSFMCNFVFSLICSFFVESRIIIVQIGLVLVHVGVLVKCTKHYRSLADEAKPTKLCRFLGAT